MSAVAEMSPMELACFVGGHLSTHGIDVVLDELARWSAREGKAQEFEIVRERLAG